MEDGAFAAIEEAAAQQIVLQQIEHRVRVQVEETGALAECGAALGPKCGVTRELAVVLVEIAYRRVFEPGIQARHASAREVQALVYGVRPIPGVRTEQARQPFAAPAAAPQRAIEEDRAARQFPGIRGVDAAAAQERIKLRDRVGLEPFIGIEQQRADLERLFLEATRGEMA